MRNILLLLTVALVSCAPARPSTEPADEQIVGEWGGCDPDSVLEESCALVPVEVLDLPGWCDYAQNLPTIFRAEDEWLDFLARCDSDVIDPLVDFDWEANDVVGSVLRSNGCEGTDGTLWLADCGDIQHLAYYATTCGDCEMQWVTVHFVAVPAGVVQQLALQSCVPEGAGCADVVE